MSEADPQSEHPLADSRTAGSQRSCRSAALYNSLVERSGVGIAALDAHCRVQSANRALLTLLDRGTAEVQDVEFTDLLQLDSGSRLQFNFNQLRMGRTGRFTECVKVKRPDGTVQGDLTAIRLRAPARVVDPLIVLLQADPATADDAQGGARPRLLSEVDAKILEGVAAGASTIQLATQLFLSSKGIEYHVSTMLRRLKVPNRPALVSRAYTMGILSGGAWPPRVQREYVY